MTGCESTRGQGHRVRRHWPEHNSRRVNSTASLFFGGVLSYGRGRNNAPSASVAPRGSAQPGWTGRLTATFMRWNSISLQGLLTLHRIFGTSCGVDWHWASCSRMSAGGALRLQVERSGHVKRRCFHQKYASSSSRAVQKGPSPVASPLKQSGCLLADPRYLCLPLTICDVAKMG